MSKGMKSLKEYLYGKKLPLSVVAILLGIMVLSPMVSAAEIKNPGVVPVYSSYLGKTYGEWGAEWWKWAYSIPKPINPLYAEGNFDASIGQSGDVWFIGGVLSTNPGSETFPPVTRTCTIPAGKALFFPIINSEASIIEGYGSNEEELRASVERDIANVSKLQVTVDGKHLKDLYSYRAQSNLFIFTLPEDNVLNKPVGPDGFAYSDAVTDGYWIMLKPLPAGEHTIRIYGAAKVYSFVTDVTYKLTVI